MGNFEKMKARLAAGETILMDGGMGSEFERRGLSPTTWSGGLCSPIRSWLRRSHEDYIRAGAEIIITKYVRDRSRHARAGRWSKDSRGEQERN